MNNKINDKEEVDIEALISKKKDEVLSINRELAQLVQTMPVNFGKERATMEDKRRILDDEIYNLNYQLRESRELLKSRQSVEIDASDSWDDLDLDELDDLPGDEPQIIKPVIEESKQALEPEIVAPKLPAIETQAGNTVAELKNRISDIFQGIDLKKRYSVDVQSELRQIAEALTVLGVCPYERGYGFFTPPDCRKYLAASQWENDKQTFDLQWDFIKYPKHKTHPTKSEGMFADVFKTQVFDWDVALKIAVGEFNKEGTNKKEHYSRDFKIEALRLTSQMMGEHCALFDDDIKSQRKKLKDDARKKAANLEKIQDRAVKIRDILEAQNVKRKNKMIVDNYVNIWIALQHSGGNWSKNAKIRKAYEEITGKVIDKSLMQRQLGILKGALDEKTYTV